MGSIDVVSICRGRGIVGCRTTANQALDNFDYQAEPSLVFDILAFSLIMATYYAISTFAMGKQKQRTQYVIMAVGLIALYLTSTQISDIGTYLGDRVWRAATEKGMTGLPYKVYGPNDPEYKLMAAKRAYEEPELKDVYTLASKDPPYLYYIAKQDTLLVVETNETISARDMRVIVSTLKEVTPAQMKRSPKGITYDAGSEP